MPDDPRIQQLLDELLDSDATPEAVCGSCIELLPVVRDRWRQVCQARAKFDALFPPAAGPGDGHPVSLPDTTTLPTIPGYEVEGVLGVGGMGVVFRARHARLNRTVALKMALAGAYAGPHERARFQREAEAVAALRHPNVVQIYEVGEADGRPYFTMEYVDGGSLDDKLPSTPLAAREAAGMIATLAAAVHAAHTCGIIHRDLKPANILLTTEGVPKVGDFGLARRLNGEAGITRSGTAVGTPSYMAPEQAGEATGVVGPSADVYSLGAILYELLTGQPPFSAARADVTLCQVLTRDPEPPSRRNAKVPHDLETICLKCLRKEPRLRYASAAALGDDLERFLRGEAIAARPEGQLGTLVRRVRRRPILSAAVAVATLSTVALVIGGLWTISDREAAKRAADLRQAAADAERAATRQAAEADLTEMAGLQGNMSWPEARAALERARGRLGDTPPPDLLVRLERGERELELVARCEALRIEEYSLRVGGIDIHRFDSEHEKAFRRSGLVFVEVESPADAAARLAASPMATFAVPTLDLWAVSCQKNPKRAAWLMETARQAAPAAAGWRARLADHSVWADDAALMNLIETAPPAYPTLPLLHLIEERMRKSHRDPTPFLRLVQRNNLGDFWANTRLANALRQNDPREAVRYYQAALGSRPDAVAVLNDLAVALEAIDRKDEALAHFRAVVTLDPQFVPGQYNLASLLGKLKRYDEQIEHVQKALRRGVRTAGLYAQLGQGFFNTGKYDDAISSAESAVALDPLNIKAQCVLRDVSLRRGQLEQARTSWAKALAADPPECGFWLGYPELCLFLGREDEYRRARSALLARFGATTDPHIASRVSWTCVLRPISGDELRNVVALADLAMASDKSKHPQLRPYYSLCKGMAAYRQGRLTHAISELRGEAAKAPGPDHRLVLAMALHQKGEVAEARKTLAAAVAPYDWRVDQVRDPEGWVRHALRREAERVIIPDLTAFLEGTYRPRDNDERLALLGVCQATNRFRAVAELYTDAFAADPRLADDLNAQNRYNAACYSAQASHGREPDDTKLREQDRTKWRARALAWLRADLAALGKTLETGSAASQGLVRKRMTLWRSDPDLTGLREPTELEKLPADERKDWAAFWSDVDALLKRAAGTN